MDAGELEIENLNNNNKFAESYSNIGNFKYNKENDIININYENTIGNNILSNDDYSAELRLNGEKIWDMDIDLGAGETTLDFSKVRINKLDLDIGAGEVELNLPSYVDSGEGKIYISGGTSSIDIELPKNVPLKINVTTGLGNVEFENDEVKLIRKGDYYVTEDYIEGMNNSLYVEISVGMGQVTIED